MVWRLLFPAAGIATLIASVWVDYPVHLAAATVALWACAVPAWTRRVRFSGTAVERRGFFRDQGAAAHVEVDATSEISFPPMWRRDKGEPSFQVTDGSGNYVEVALWFWSRWRPFVGAVARRALSVGATIDHRSQRRIERAAMEWH
jgi:hypothetical protein